MLYSGKYNNFKAVVKVEYVKFIPAFTVLESLFITIDAEADVAVCEELDEA